jgi:hypothetical protein
VAAVLQVDEGNYVAQRLYERLGFRREQHWTHWRRSSTLRVPPPLLQQRFYITRRRDQEWGAEMALALRARRHASGILGWQRPIHAKLFRASPIRILRNLINLRSVEHLIIRGDDGTGLRAALWIDSAFAASAVQLTLMTDPDYAGVYEEALINSAVRRYGARSPLTVEHPTHDETTRHVLLRYGFHTQRTLLHMRWDTHTA